MIGLVHETWIGKCYTPKEMLTTPSLDQPSIVAIN